MFMAADWVVKSVMIGPRANRAFAIITESDTLADADQNLTNRGGPAAFTVGSADEEYRKSAAALDVAGDSGVKELLVLRLVRIEARAGRPLTRGTGVLAKIGATSPFVGLFGTGWGIMNSFIGSAQAQTTNLAVVAPGIAEALLATALGLVAAIPAVMIYNLFARAPAAASRRWRQPGLRWLEKRISQNTRQSRSRSIDMTYALPCFPSLISSLT